jgi:TolA-binding protein
MVCPDPATLLFYRGACYHAQLKIKDALSDLRRLLQRKDQIPARYARTAEMMVADIKPLKKDSLDEISRLMSDVTRRLDLGRADEATQEREQEVIDKLTKLIDKIEEEQQKQQQQQQQQQNASGNGGKSDGQSSPMDDSRIAGANGQGDVDRKKIDDQNGWGNLPPAERQESLQQISRDLPTHYREAIEAYFRKLATQK